MNRRKLNYLEVPNDEIGVRATGGHGASITLVSLDDINTCDGVLMQCGQGGVTAVCTSCTVQRLELTHRTAQLPTILLFSTK